MNNQNQKETYTIKELLTNECNYIDCLNNKIFNFKINPNIEIKIKEGLK